MTTWLFVGLGNPGPQYALTRHNIGFMVLDRYVHKKNLGEFKKTDNRYELKFKVGQNQIVLQKPQTFMNLSAEAVLPALQFYKVNPKEHLVVLHDELDINFGEIKIQSNRGGGGHNGIKSIHGAIGPDYARIRLGIGRPTHPGFDISNWVLAKFGEEEIPNLDKFLDYGCEVIESILVQGLSQTATKFSGKKGI